MNNEQLTINNEKSTVISECALLLGGVHQPTVARGGNG
jgi:hypothetical protein